MVICSLVCPVRFRPCYGVSLCRPPHRVLPYWRVRCPVRIFKLSLERPCFGLSLYVIVCRLHRRQPLCLHVRIGKLSYKHPCRGLSRHWHFLSLYVCHRLWLCLVMGILCLYCPVFFCPCLGICLCFGPYRLFPYRWCRLWLSMVMLHFATPFLANIVYFHFLSFLYDCLSRNLSKFVKHLWL